MTDVWRVLLKDHANDFLRQASLLVRANGGSAMLVKPVVGIIARYCNPTEAVQDAVVSLLEAKLSSAEDLRTPTVEERNEALERLFAKSIVGSLEVLPNQKDYAMRALQLEIFVEALISLLACQTETKDGLVESVAFEFDRIRTNAAT